MLRLLIRLLIKNKDNTAAPDVRRAYGKLCSVYGIFLNILLFAAKLAAGIISSSVAVIADAFNNLSDAASSIITLLGFVFAGKKPDLHHPFGHGRAEYIAGLVLSFIIALTGIELFISSVEEIITPSPIELSLLPALILSFSILVKIYMAFYNLRIGKLIDSAAMRATAADALSDTAATALVLFSMLIGHFTSLHIDGWAGLIVAIFILLAAYKSARETISPLLGQAPDPELIRAIEDSVLAYPELLDIHDLIIHDYGPGRVFVSLHAEVDGEGELFALHDVIDAAETELNRKLNVIATIHMDPIESQGSELMQLKNAVEEKLRELVPELSIHDFRRVPGTKHTKLIFDAAVPADLPCSDESISALVLETVAQNFPNHRAVVMIDRIYT